VSVAVRVIPCLDVDNGRVVKGVNFVELRDAGDPVQLARAYDAAGADELVFLDITASSGDRETTYDVVRRTAETVFIPLTVGGGVREPEDFNRLLRAGADKVSVTAALLDPRLLSEAAEVRIAVRRAERGRPSLSDGVTTDSGFEVTHGGRRSTGIDAIAWAAEGACLGRARSSELHGCRRHGVGLRRHADRAGGRAVSVPLIASGGAGQASDIVTAVRSGADAVLAASVFHFGTLSIGAVKDELARSGFQVR
jgi:cyclase